MSQVNGTIDPLARPRLSPATRALMACAVYWCVFSYLCIMRYASGCLGDPDLGLFDQAFWTTVNKGWLLYNTYELGSHFRIHNSPVFFLLVPFYWLVPRLETLLVLQTGAIALGGWGVFLLARLFLGAERAVTCVYIYLMYHPLHGVNYDQVNELAFAVAPLIFSFYFLYTRRIGLYWLSLLVFLSTKEDMSFVVMMIGLYVAGLAWWRRRRGEPLLGAGNASVGRAHATPGQETVPEEEGDLVPSRSLIWVGLATFALGAFWLYFSLQVVFPYFRGGKAWPYFEYYYPHLGRNMSEAVTTLVTRPGVAVPYLFSRGVVLLFFELLVPLALYPLLCPGLLVMLGPTWGVLALSAFGGTHNTGSRYMAPIVGILMVAFIQGVDRLSRWSRGGLPASTCEVQARVERLLKWPLALTILMSLAINTTPVRFPFKNIPRISPHERARLELVALIPPDASVSTQPDLYSRVSKRVQVYVGYEKGTDYLLVDSHPLPSDRPNPLRWYNHCHWDRDLPPLLGNGEYVLVREVEDARLYRRADLRSSGSAVPLTPRE